MIGLARQVRVVSVLAVLPFFLVGVAAAQEPEVPVVTLDEAIRLALLADPALAATDAAITNAGADMLEARGSWLPPLTLNGTYANSSNQRFDQTTGQLVSESYTAQIQTNYELFGGGRRIAQRRQAGAVMRAAEANHRAQEYTTRLNTTDAFFRAAAAEELVRAAEQRLARARQQHEFAQTRLEVGTATRSDVLRAEIELANAELGLVEAEASLRSARLELGRLIGRSGPVRPAEFALPDSAPELPPLESLLARAERAAPVTLAAQAAAEERGAAKWAAFASYLPTLRAIGGYDWFAYQFPPSQRSWSLRLVASLPVLNGFQREAAISRATAAARVAEVRARDAVLAARVSTENAVNEIAAAERRVAIARRTVELAEEDLRVQEERYRIGNATILELQSSQLALTEAVIEWVRARQALGVAVARLEAVLGESLR